MKLTNGDLAGMDAGQLREHLSDYLDEPTNDEDYDPFEDEYADGVARIISSLLYGEAGQAGWVLHDVLSQHGWFEDDEDDDDDSERETDECPEHGTQLVLGYGATPGPDPYAVNRLACGHGVTSFGPNEPNVIVR